MDIVSRLKIFMNSLDMTSSQFADSCRIPRPSLSQLLNGRNKKVSDEIVAKIHDSFPELSIMWLLFGEGTMVINSINQFSEPQNTLFPDLHKAQTSYNQHDNNKDISLENDIDISPNKITQPLSDIIGENTATTSRQQSQPSKSPQTAIKLNPKENKRITNIVVFYDDNSFESFSPSCC